MSAVTRFLAASIGGTLMFAVPAHAGDPQPIPEATATASCSPYTIFFDLAPPTQPSSRARHLVRATVASGSVDVFRNDGSVDDVGGRAGDVMWTTGAGHSPFTPWGNAGRCNTAGASLSGVFYDVPEVPTSFSGRSTRVTSSSTNSSLRAVARTGARYYADISVSQGSIAVAGMDLGSSEKIVGSAGRIELNYQVKNALIGVDVTAQDGPPAQWTVVLNPYPLAITGVRANVAAVAPARPVVFEYEFTNDAMVDAVIVNASGTPVYSLAAGLAVAGDSTRTLTWDGLNAGGERVPDGVYRLVINGRDAFETTAHAEAAVTVDGTGPAITAVSPANIESRGAITVAVTDPSGVGVGQTSATQTTRPGYYSHPHTQSMSAMEKRLTYDAPEGGWKPGTINVDVTASDSLGNAGTKHLAFTVPAPGGAQRAPLGRAASKGVRAFCSNRRGSAVIRRRAPRNCLVFGPGGTFGGGVNLTRLHWRRWGRASASAKGREIGFHVPRSRISVRVRAYRLRNGCGGYRVYTRLKATSRHGSTTARLRSCR